MWYYLLALIIAIWLDIEVVINIIDQNVSDYNKATKIVFLNILLILFVARTIRKIFIIQEREEYGVTIK